MPENLRELANFCPTSSGVLFPYSRFLFRNAITNSSQSAQISIKIWIQVLPFSDYFVT